MPKKKAPLHGAEGAPSFGLCDQNSPRATEPRSPDHRSGRMVLPILINKNVLGVAQQFFFFQNGQDCAPKCAKAYLRKNFRTAKILAPQAASTQKQKSPFSNRKNGLSRYIGRFV